MAEQALSGIKVLDLTHCVAGPYSTKAMADFGTDVIKVERPGVGDAAREIGPFIDDKPDREGGGLFLYLNTNKKSVTLNLKSPEGFEILKKLVEKGVLTQQEAKSVMQEMEKEAVEQDKVVEKKIDKRVAEVQPADQKDVDKVVKALKKLKIGFLWYLSYQNGENGHGDGEDYNRFAIKRGYINIKYKFTPWFHFFTH